MTEADDRRRMLITDISTFNRRFLDAPQKLGRGLRNYFKLRHAQLDHAVDWVLVFIWLYSSETIETIP